MSDDQASVQRELLARARKQMTAVTREFQRGLSSVKDPVQRKRLTDAYAELMQRYLAKARSIRARSEDTQPTIGDSTEDEAAKAGRSGKSIAVGLGLAAAALGAAAALRAIRASDEDEVVITASEATFESAPPDVTTSDDV
jgi:hypothetical protein